MIIQARMYLFPLIFIALLLTGCSNVRWKHPTPSEEIMKTMMIEIQGARSIDGDEFPIPETRARLKAQNIPAGTRPFQVVSIGENNKLTVNGYTEFLNSIELFTDKDFARFAIPNQNNIRGYYYAYQGLMKTVRYSIPHMVLNSNSKDSLVLYTKPLTDYHVTLIYTDGSKYEFSYHSSNVSIGIFGPSKSYSGTFNGTFHVSPDYKTGKYELSSPRGR
ncbi:MAG: hypothetical protein PV362_05450 [Providencia heimbachae]|nr:hypothetical protein [Providencia heimbachae]